MTRRISDSVIPILLTLTAIALATVGLAVTSGGRGTVFATHGNLNVHVHDDFYHPAGAFGSPTDHNLAQQACQVAKPAAACDAVIHAGDTITWVAPAPLAVNPHTVTECTDNTFNVCGPSVDPANPIGDSGVRSPPPAVAPTGWPYGPIQFNAPGVHYYRCEVHPTVMRGRIVVQAPPVGGFSVDLDRDGLALETAPDGSGPSASVIAAVAAGAFAGVLVLGSGAWYVRRRRV